MQKTRKDKTALYECTEGETGEKDRESGRTACDGVPWIYIRRHESVRELDGRRMRGRVDTLTYRKMLSAGYRKTSRWRRKSRDAVRAKTHGAPAFFCRYALSN